MVRSWLFLTAGIVLALFTLGLGSLLPRNPSDSEALELWRTSSPKMLFTGA
jgi:hypothetical protein